MPDPQSNLNLLFDVDALEELRRIDASHRAMFSKKLEKLVTRRELPSPKNALHGFPPGYFKIKLRRAGLRLVYHYDGENLIILVIAVGKRNRNIVYEVAKARIEGKK